MEHVVDEPRKRIAVQVSENVRATLEQAAKHFGFVPLPSNELELFLPAATVQGALGEEG